MEPCGTPQVMGNIWDETPPILNIVVYHLNSIWAIQVQGLLYHNNQFI